MAHEAATEPAPDPAVTGRWYSLDEPGDNSLPKPPLSGKTTGGVPQLAILPRVP